MVNADKKVSGIVRLTINACLIPRKIRKVIKTRMIVSLKFDVKSLNC